MTVGMSNFGQQAAVANAFKVAGYDGPLLTGSVVSGDERAFLLEADALRAIRDLRALTQALQQLLGLTVFVVERNDVWGVPTPFE